MGLGSLPIYVSNTPYITMRLLLAINQCITHFFITIYALISVLHVILISILYCTYTCIIVMYMWTVGFSWKSLFRLSTKLNQQCHENCLQNVLLTQTYPGLTGYNRLSGDIRDFVTRRIFLFF